MKAVPLSVLVNALEAMQKSIDHMNDKPVAGAPYVPMLSARSELSYYVKEMLKEIKAEVAA